MVIYGKLNIVIFPVTEQSEDKGLKSPLKVARPENDKISTKPLFIILTVRNILKLGNGKKNYLGMKILRLFFIHGFISIYFLFLFFL